MANRKGNALGGWIIIGLLVWGLSQCGRFSPEDSPQAPLPVQQNIVPAAPAPPLPSVSAPPVSVGAEVRYVVASGLNLRKTPGTSGTKIATLPQGTALAVLEARGAWFRVSAGGGLEGWVHGEYTATTAPVPAVPAPALVQQPDAPESVPSRPRSEIIQLIIARSINAYSGSCPCPYNVDRAGRRCGARSAYSKPGGASPICYESDVTDAMIQGFLR